VPRCYEAEHERNDHRKEGAQYGVQHYLFSIIYSALPGKLVLLERVAQDGTANQRTEGAFFERIPVLDSAEHRRLCAIDGRNRIARDAVQVRCLNVVLSRA
jgi:hypothetical protein